jgi:hypothetical protein
MVQNCGWKGGNHHAQLLPMFWGFVAAVCFVSVPLIVAQLHAPARYKPLAFLQALGLKVGIESPKLLGRILIAALLLGVGISLFSIRAGRMASAERETKARASLEQLEREKSAAKAWKEKKKLAADEEALKLEVDRPARDEAFRKQAEENRARAAEADRVEREIRAKVLASAFTYDMTVVANREDGLVVREASAEGKLFFVPHVTATKRLPLSREFSAKGWRRGLTYRLNDTTVLEVITLAE